MPTASDGSPAPDAGQRATSGPADATPATTSTAGPPLKWRILFAVAAMSTVLAFQLVNGIDDLLGQFTADGAESQTMGALIDHEWQDVDDWTRAATTWEAWSISNCPAALVGSSCPARATVPPLDLARTHLLWDLGWLVPSLAALLASLHLIAHADRPKGAGADGRGTADDQSFPAWLGSGVVRGSSSAPRWRR
jgi:hypothetical protein